MIELVDVHEKKFEILYTIKGLPERNEADRRYNDHYAERYFAAMQGKYIPPNLDVIFKIESNTLINYENSRTYTD